MEKKPTSIQYIEVSYFITFLQNCQIVIGKFVCYSIDDQRDARTMEWAHSFETSFHGCERIQRPHSLEHGKWSETVIHEVVSKYIRNWYLWNYDNADHFLQRRNERKAWIVVSTVLLQWEIRNESKTWTRVHDK